MRRVFFIAAAALLAPSIAHAQAWTPPAGSGWVSISFQSVNHTGHLYSDGTYADESRSLSGAAYLDIEYGITRRLAAAVAIPEVWARYTDDEDPPFPIAEIDRCRCWHAALQDFGFTARYNLVDTFDHVFVVTPVVSFGTPSHKYGYDGESAPGRRMSEARIGADATYRLDAISRNLSLNAHYTYAFVERVIDVGTNRSNLGVAGTYRFARNWSVSGFFSWQRTHGGLRAPSEITSQERFDNHDRLLRENWTHVGAEASYRLGMTRLFGSYTYVLLGTDAHPGYALLGGVAIPFSIRH